MGDHGSFWATAEREVTISDILVRPDVKLEDVLDFADVIRDIKYQIEALIQYISEPEIITSMINYIIQRRPLKFTSQIEDVEQDDEIELSAKRAHVCTEIFQSAPISFITQVVKEPTHLRHLFSFLDTDETIDPAYTGAFRKVMLTLAQRRPQAIAHFVQNDLVGGQTDVSIADEEPKPQGESNDKLEESGAKTIESSSILGSRRSNSLNALIKHIYLHPALEILIHIGWDTGHPMIGVNSSRDTSWLTEYGFLDQLLDTANDLMMTQVSVADDVLANELIYYRRFEYLANAARAIIDLVSKCPTSSVLGGLQRPEIISKLMRLIHPILGFENDEVIESFKESMKNIQDTTGAAAALANVLASVVLLAHHQMQMDEENANMSLDEAMAGKTIKSMNYSSDLLPKASSGTSDPELSATLSSISDETNSTNTQNHHRLSALLEQIVQNLPFFLGVLAGDDTSVISHNLWTGNPHEERCRKLYDAGVDLAASVTRQSFSTPNGRVVVPFGEFRVKTLELIGLLLRVRDKEVESALVSTRAMKLVLSLMPRHPSNSLVHALIESCICTVLQADSKEIYENLVYDAGMLHWIRECRLMHEKDPLNYPKLSQQRLSFSGKSTNDSTTTSESTVGTSQVKALFKMGYLPFLNRIGKIVCSVASSDPVLREIFEAASTRSAADVRNASAGLGSQSEEQDIWDQVRQWEETLKTPNSELIYQKMGKKALDMRKGSDDDSYYNELIRQSPNNGSPADSASFVFADNDDDDRLVDRETIIRAMNEGSVIENNGQAVQGGFDDDDDSDDGFNYNSASRDSSDTDSDSDENADEIHQGFNKSVQQGNGAQTASGRVFVPSSASSVAGAWGLNTNGSGSTGMAHDGDGDGEGYHQSGENGDEGEIAASLTIASNNLTRSASGSLKNHSNLTKIPKAVFIDDDDDPFAFVTSSTPAAGVQSIIAGTPQSTSDEDKDDDHDNDSSDDDDLQSTSTDPDADYDPFADFSNNGLIMAADKIPEALVRSCRTKSKPDASSLSAPVVPSLDKHEEAVHSPGFDDFDDPFADLATTSVKQPSVNEKNGANSSSDKIADNSNDANDSNDKRDTNEKGKANEAIATNDINDESLVSTLETFGSDDEDGTSLRAVTELMAKHSDPSTPVITSGGNNVSSVNDQSFSPILSATAPEKVRLSASNLDDLAIAATSAVSALMSQAAVESNWCGEDPFE